MIKNEHKYIISSISNLKKILNERNLTNLSIDEKIELTKTKIEINFQQSSCIYKDENGEEKDEESLKMASPFTEHFKKIIEAHQINIIYSDSEKSKNENEYYCPDLYKIIKSYLHLVPLWTGMMIKNWEDLNPNYKGKIVVSRKDNQKVENWFDVLKNHILFHKKRKPSELTVLVHKKIEATYEETYKNVCDSIVLNKDKRK